MENLPPGVITHIFEYADTSYVENYYPETRLINDRDLTNCRLVSKGWNRAFYDIYSRYVMSTLLVETHEIDRNSLQDMYRQVAIKGSYVRELCVSLDARRAFTPASHDHDADQAEVDWDTLLTYCPNVCRLDMEESFIQSPDFNSVLQAASTRCLDIESLILQTDSSYVQADSHQAKPQTAFMETLENALRSWYTNGRKRGLKQLRMMMNNDNTMHSPVKELMELVIQYCPEIEYLDGYAQHVSVLDEMNFQEQWHIGSNLWERFCATCTEIREFEWIVVPYSDLFFQTWAKYPKPRLNSLTLSIPMNWDWEAYFSQMDMDDPIRQSPYGYHAKDVCLVLDACPNLKAIHVMLYGYNDGQLDFEDVFDDSFLMDEMDDWRSLPTSPMFNVELFNDDFCMRVVSKCPHLEQISFWRVADSIPRPFIEGLGDAGLQALATLPKLKMLDLPPMNVTANGLISLLTEFPDTFHGQRNVSLTIGEKHGHFQVDFYEVISTFLLQLRDMDCPPGLKHKCAMRIKSGRVTPLDADFDLTIDEVAKLANEVSKKHPLLCLKLVSNRGRDDPDPELFEIGVYTSTAKPSIYYDWYHSQEYERGDDPIWLYRKCEEFASEE